MPCFCLVLAYSLPSLNLYFTPAWILAEYLPAGAMCRGCTVPPECGSAPPTKRHRWYCWWCLQAVATHHPPRHCRHSQWHTDGPRSLLAATAGGVCGWLLTTGWHSPPLHPCRWQCCGCLWELPSWHHHTPTIDSATSNSATPSGGTHRSWQKTSRLDWVCFWMS